MKRALPLLLLAGAFGACSSFTTAASDAPGNDAGGQDGAPPAPEDSGRLELDDAGDAGDAGNEMEPDADRNGVVTLVSGVASGSGIAVVGHVVYWTDANNGYVYRVSPAGVMNQVAFTHGAPRNPVVTKDGVYWCDTKNFDGVLADGGAYVLFQPSGAGTPRAAFVDGACNEIAAFDDGSIAFVHGGQSGAVGFASAGLDRFLPAQVPYPSGNPYAIATHGDDVYLTVSSLARVDRLHGVKTATAGSAPFATGTDDCEHITTNAAGVFWTKPGKGSVEVKLHGGGNIGGITGENLPRSIVAADTMVYWRNGTMVRQASSSLGVGPATDFATASEPDGGFNEHFRTTALSDGRVYWLTADGVQWKAR